MLRRLSLACSLWLIGAAVAAPKEISIDPGAPVGRIDDKIYGHFLEHIYHSVNGGLWGEMIWDRSLEGGGGGGARWRIEGESVVQDGTGENVRLVFGDPAWKDYEFSLEARKTGGREGFLILFRVVDAKRFYWANLGGWGNERHCLEKGSADRARWGQVGPQVAGRIETGQWYRIRVRCEGPRFRVWIGDDEIIDYTDGEGAHLAGAVGIGTWGTQARFRDLRVASLDGPTLFEGLPALESRRAVPEPVVPHAWGAYGPGEVSPAGEDPLNGDRCRRIVANGGVANGAVAKEGETGITQMPLCLRKGEMYAGSIWARGRAPAGLVVRLRDGEKVLAEKDLPAPGSAWREFPFALVPAAAADNATIQVGARGEAEVWIDQVSLMPEKALRIGGYRPDLLRAIADLRPPVIRWPGGSFASFYRWKSGIGPQAQRVKYPRSMWDDVDVNSFGTDEFIRMCRRIGAEPLIVINVGSTDDRGKREEYLREACEWVEYANGPATSTWGAKRAANGHTEPYGVTYWEIDNEIWRLAPDDYASVVNAFVPAMKRVAPSIIVAACGSGQLGTIWGAGDLAVIERCAAQVDYLSIHHYEDPNRFAEGPAAAEAFWGRLAGSIGKSANPKLRLYVSEWNAQSTDWRTGLYAAGILNAFERAGDAVGMAGPALFLRHVSARSWDNAFINFDHRTWFPAPNYVVMKLWRDHYAPIRLGTEGDADPLNGIATKTEDGRAIYYKVVNPTGEAIPVALRVGDGFPVGDASILVVAPDALDARNTLAEPNRIRPLGGTVEVRGQTVRFELPRWSAAAVTIRRPVTAHPFDLGKVRLLAGPFRDAMERDRRYLHALDADRLLHTWRINAGLPSAAKPLGGWEKPSCELRGHTLGHYLSACALMVASTGDEALRAKADRIVAELARCQEALGTNGYLSAFPESFFDRVENRKPVWAPYYTLHKVMAGLLDMHVLAGNEQALEIVERMAGWLADRLAGIDRARMQGILDATEQGGMCEVLANLSAVTEEKEYLALARRFNQDRYVEPLARGEDRLAGEHVNSFIPNIIGTARQYEIGGDERDRRIAEYFWHQVTGARTYVTGGTSDVEHWRGAPHELADHLSDRTQETCCTYNMLKLTRHLFRWDPRPQYMDYYERALWTSILATQNPEPGPLCGMMMYFVPLAPGYWKYFNRPNDSFWCCTGTGLENHAKYGDTIYFRDGDALYVNLFIASEIEWPEKGLRLRQETRFPEEEGTALVLHCDAPVSLRLRIRVPWWATRGVRATLNGKAVDADPPPSSYLAIDRTFRDGDRIEVRMPMRVAVEAMPDDDSLVAFLYGPLVLAGRLGSEGLEPDDFSSENNNIRGDFYRGRTVPAPLLVARGADPEAWIERVPGEPLTFRTKGQEKDVTLVPYYRLFGERYAVYFRVRRGE
ncbi:MAG: glycoside hydrolase family 127 protein [Planctomycetes bacterium]|nr:glycoside hydrolase family 127 protein [Planctomycetota bacterium]